MTQKNILIPTNVLLQEGLREYFRLLAEEAQQDYQAALRENDHIAPSRLLEMV
jgi:hypothetical protein